jgi:hypothetical protein
LHESEGPDNVKNSKRLGKRSSNSYEDDIWTLPSRKRLKQPSVEAQEASLIPKDHDIVDRIIDIDEDDDGVPIYRVRYEKGTNKVRPRPRWLHQEDFVDINEFRSNIDIVVRWKQSGLSKANFYRFDEAARNVLDFSRNAGADDEGWCSFRAVGVAIELLTGKQVVSSDLLRRFKSAVLNDIQLVKTLSMEPGGLNCMHSSVTSAAEKLVSIFPTTATNY